MILSEVKDYIKSQPNDRKLSKNDVLHHLKTITQIEKGDQTNTSTPKFKPKHLKKGDIIKNGVAFKVRPCVVIKVEKDIVYSIPLSTTENSNNLCETKSRFFENSYFSKSIVSNTIEVALKNYTGIYDNSKHLNKVIKQLKETLINF